eukprot:Gb_08013 [translate_table: standard]
MIYINISQDISPIGHIVENRNQEAMLLEWHVPYLEILGMVEPVSPKMVELEFVEEVQVEFVAMVHSRIMGYMDKSEIQVEQSKGYMVAYSGGILPPCGLEWTPEGEGVLECGTAWVGLCCPLCKEAREVGHVVVDLLVKEVYLIDGVLVEEAHFENIHMEEERYEEILQGSLEDKLGLVDCEEDSSCEVLVDVETKDTKMSLGGSLSGTSFVLMGGNEDPVRGKEGI